MTIAPDDPFSIHRRGRSLFRHRWFRAGLGTFAVAGSATMVTVAWPVAGEPVLVFFAAASVVAGWLAYPPRG